jgi:hypothetical protein
MTTMIKELFQFRKEDVYMWAGVGLFSLIIIVALSFISSTGLVLKDLFGLAVILILPGYVIVKLFFDNVEISENMTKNPDINKAIDKLVMSLGVSIATIIPLNFLWKYLLDMGIEVSKNGAADVVGTMEDEMMYSGNASWRSLFTVVLVVGIAVGVKIYQLKFQKK